MFGCNLPGPLVLDFESYKPRYQSAEQIYRDRSKDFVRERDPTLNKYDARKEAETIFNTTAKTFFEVKGFNSKKDILT